MAPVCAELLVPSHNHWASLPLPQGPGLEPLLFPMLIFPRLTGSGTVILGKRLVVPGPSRGISHPKQISPGPLGSLWIPEGLGVS